MEETKCCFKWECPYCKSSKLMSTSEIKNEESKMVTKLRCSGCGYDLPLIWDDSQDCWIKRYE